MIRLFTSTQNTLEVVLAMLAIKNANITRILSAADHMSPSQDDMGLILDLFDVPFIETLK